MPLTPPPGWVANALCAQTDPDAFYPDVGDNANCARAVCASCPVQAECLDYAITNREQFGIWGGLTPQQRQKIRRAAA